jgi:phosphosulfolactate phosphohydrolase-like enzyme
LNIHKDVSFCMTADKYDVVPRLNLGVLEI